MITTKTLLIAYYIISLFFTFGCSGKSIGNLITSILFCWILFPIYIIVFFAMYYGYIYDIKSLAPTVSKFIDILKKAQKKFKNHEN